MSEDDSMLVTRQQEVSQVRVSKPHVVILGAGASYAALPTGDASGKLLPLMSNFTSIVPMPESLTIIEPDYQSQNFEELYSRLALDPRQNEVVDAINVSVRDYFSSIEIPATPTLYDYLVLSLREKDVIATFNWDPLLIQAVRRNTGPHAPPPRLLFLHGNVSVGYCESDDVVGYLGRNCSNCGNPFSVIPLLYPVTAKEYQRNQAINRFWQEIRKHLRSAHMVTVFGYGAPQTDVEAKRLLTDAWAGAGRRFIEQIEIIDTKSEDDLLNTWAPFIYSHHYAIHSDYMSSWINRHPRRSGEAFANQMLEARFIEDNPPPVNCDLSTLQQWFKGLIDVEYQARGKS
jgi:hypothetical protein